MRRKESADDYRYFPEPDLVPIVLSETDIDELRATLPELPHDRYRRYISDLNLTPYSASTLINEKALSDYFEEALKICKSPRLLCNWITVEFAGKLKESGRRFSTWASRPATSPNSLQMIESKQITGPHRQRPSPTRWSQIPASIPKRSSNKIPTTSPSPTPPRSNRSSIRFSPPIPNRSPILKRAAKKPLPFSSALS